MRSFTRLALQKLRHAIERFVRARLERVAGGVEQHIAAEREHHAALGLLGLQVRQLRLCRRRLIVSRGGLIPRSRGLIRAVAA